MADPSIARAERGQIRRRALRTFFKHTAASTVVPGLGLLRTPWRRLGMALVALVLLAAVVLGIQVVRTGAMRTALQFGLSRERLLLVLVALVAGALIWCVAIILTARITRPMPMSAPDRRIVIGFTMLCCVLVAAPTAVVGRAVAAQREVIDVVFGTGSSSTKPMTAQADPWAKIPRVNMLLLGSDAGTDRVGIRTDSMMVASIDTKTGNTVLFGIPRNLENVPFSKKNPLHALYPDGFNCGSECLMNAVWTLADDHRDLFPGDKTPGLTATKDAIEQILGLKINDTTIIDLSGFAQLVDAMGGVDVNVQRRVCVGCKESGGQVVFSNGKPEYIEPGLQHLNGRLALWYARSRAESDDFDRMRRQRCVAGAILDQANPVRLLANYTALAKALQDNVSVSIPQSDLPAWATLVERIQGGKIRSLPLTNKVIDVVHPDFEKIHAMVQAAIHPAAKPATPTPSATTTTAPTTPTPSAPSASTTTEQNDGLTDLAASC